MSAGTVNRDRITDEDLLDWLVDGTLVVDIKTTQVTCRGRVLKPTIVGRDDRNGTRYQVSIRHSRPQAHHRSVAVGLHGWQPANHSRRL